MRYLHGFLIVLLISIVAVANEYILVEDYYKTHPQEEMIAESFNKIVQDKPVPLTAKQKNPVKITIVYPSLQLSDYWQKSRVSFEKRLQELGILYDITNYSTKPGTNVAEQAQQIMEATKKDVDYLVFTLDVNKHKKLIEQVLRQKKPKLILQNITTPLAGLGERQPFLYVGFDHTIGTKMLAKYFMQHFPNDSQYGLLFHNTGGYVSKMRGDYFKDYLDANSDMRLVDSYYTEVDFNKSYNATKTILQKYPDVKFIYACSTDIALGACKAIEDMNKTGSVSVNGWGGGEAELKKIYNKELDVTVMRMNDDNGVAMAEAIKLDLEGKDNEVPLIYSGEFVLIDQNTSKKDIEKYKNRAFRYSVDR